MAEKFSIPSSRKEAKRKDGPESHETRLAHLIEYARHNMYRAATHERADEVHEAFRAGLTELLKELHVSRIDEVLEHLETCFKRGEHDLVAEFLSNLSKLQHRDFGQEFLRLQGLSAPILVPATPTEAGNNDTAGHDATRLGHTVVNYLDSAPSA